MPPEPIPDPIPGLNTHRLLALLEGETALFLRHRPRSADLLTRASRAMPGDVAMPWMLRHSDHPPRFVTGGQDSRFTDVGGHGCIDFTLADRSDTMGCGDTPVARAVARQAKLGAQTLLPDESAIPLAQRTGMPFWQYTLTSSAANTEVFRMARALTGKARIAMFRGGYRGHIGQTMVSIGADGRGQPAALSLMPSVARDTVPVPSNDLTALAVELARGDVAAVVTEPALTNAALALSDPGFLQMACRMARAAGAVFVRDATRAWQIAGGGMMRQMGLDCDVPCLGKGLGSGIAPGLLPHDPGACRRAGRPARRAGGRTPRHRHGRHDPRQSPARGRSPCHAGRGADQRRICPDFGSWRPPVSRDRRHDRAASSALAGLPPGPPHRSLGRTVDAQPDQCRAPGFAAARGIWEAIHSARPQVGFSHDAADIDGYPAVAADFLDQVT